MTDDQGTSEASTNEVSAPQPAQIEISDPEFNRVDFVLKQYADEATQFSFDNKMLKSRIVELEGIIRAKDAAPTQNRAARRSTPKKPR